MYYARILIKLMMECLAVKLGSQIDITQAIVNKIHTNIYQNKLVFEYTTMNHEFDIFSYSYTALI